MEPASIEVDRNAIIPAAGGQSGNAAEEDQQSAVDELNAVDPSPSPAAHSELDSLAEMVDALEATPFPETQVGAHESTREDESETKSERGPSPPDESGSESSDQAAAWPMNFRSIPWKEVLDWYSTIAGLPLRADEFPEGTFNFTDTEQHSLQEITGILQPVLRTKGLLLKRQPNGIQLFRIKGTEGGNLLGVELPTHDKLVEKRKAFQDLQNRIAELNEQRGKVPDGAPDREKQLAIIKAKTDTLQAELQTAIRILEAESQEAQIVVADAERLAQQAAAINANSAECVPQNVLFRLQRELRLAKATLDEIDAVLSVGK
jgi:hypothetical protein